MQSLFKDLVIIKQGFSGGSAVKKKKKKNLPAMQKMQVRSLGWEDPLEKEMATHSSVLTSEIPWTQEPGGLQSMGSQSQIQFNDGTTTAIIKQP